MPVKTAVLCVLFTSFAVHYAWRMRGTVIGGEKGAMLPGLFAGLSLALFSGGGIAENFFIPAAAGLAAFSYGGIEPYGETLHFIVSRSFGRAEVGRAYCGVALKGALWFSVGGGIVGMSVSAMGGRYSARQIALFIALIFVLQALGYGIFNQPYKPSEGRLPGIYFSIKSREEWGSNAGVLAAILIMCALGKDLLALRTALCGFVFGAVGWIAAMRLYLITENPMKNGRFLFGALWKKRLVGGWSNMEYCIGTFGGAGLALGFVLSGKQLGEVNSSIAKNGVFSPLAGYETASLLALCACFAVLLAINIFEYECGVKGKKYNGFAMDCLERPFFNTLPLAPVLLGCLPCAKLMTAFMLLYVLCLKNWFDRFRAGTARNVFIAVSSLVCAAVFALTLWTEAVTPPVIFLSGGIPYLFTEALWGFLYGRDKNGKRLVSSLNSFTFNLLLMTVQSLIAAGAGVLLSAKL